MLITYIKGEPLQKFKFPWHKMKFSINWLFCPYRLNQHRSWTVYWIFTKLGHIIPLWKGKKNPIYFGVITIISFDNLYRRAYFVMHTFLVLVSFRFCFILFRFCCVSFRFCFVSCFAITLSKRWMFYFGAFQMVRKK